MNKLEKIDAIYDKIADKTLSFGCILKTRLWWNVRYTGEKYYSNSMYGSYIKWNEEYNDHWIAIVIADWSQLIISAIIWHPVMIWDVLDWIEEKYPLIGDYESIHDKLLWHDSKSRERDEKRKPIEDQSDECVAFVYSLIDK